MNLIIKTGEERVNIGRVLDNRDITYSLQAKDRIKGKLYSNALNLSQMITFQQQCILLSIIHHQYIF